MEIDDLLNDVIAHIPPESIPAQFLDAVRVTDIQGKVHRLEGKGMVDWIDNLAAGNPWEVEFRGCQLLLNIAKIKARILGDVLLIYSKVGMHGTEQ